MNGHVKKAVMSRIIAYAVWALCLPRRVAVVRAVVERVAVPVAHLRSVVGQVVQLANDGMIYI